MSLSFVSLAIVTTLSSFVETLKAVGSVLAFVVEFAVFVVELVVEAVVGFVVAAVEVPVGFSVLAVIEQH